MCESLRKHAATQAQKRDNTSTKEKGKVVDLEAEEGMEYIDTEGVDLISKLSDYIPPRKGKVKVPKDPVVGQFLLNTPLLPKSVTFERLVLGADPAFEVGGLRFGRP